MSRPLRLKHYPNFKDPSDLIQTLLCHPIIADKSTEELVQIIEAFGKYELKKAQIEANIDTRKKGIYLLSGLSCVFLLTGAIIAFTNPLSAILPFCGAVGCAGGAVAIVTGNKNSIEDMSKMIPAAQIAKLIANERKINNNNNDDNDDDDDDDDDDDEQSDKQESK